MGTVSAEEGAYLASLARKAIDHYFATGKKLAPDKDNASQSFVRSGMSTSEFHYKNKGVLSEKRGVFVTLETYPKHELRGCIGYPLPIKELALAVVDCALSAAFEDPRFPPLEKSELEKIVVEVSVLSVPEEISVKSPDEYPKKIKIGRDGLIISYGYSSGLLLPQVPVEWNWNETEFLSHLCEKAGLPKEMWRSPSVKISSFSATIFQEEKPGGKVAQKKLVR